MDAARSIVRHFPVGDADTIEALTEGHINETYRIHTPRGEYILQRINTDIDPASEEDIWRVTEHARAKGILLPQFIRTNGGDLVYEHEGVWRLMTFIDGTTISRSTVTTAQLASAARCVGRFHTALADYTGGFAPRHTHFHDTPYIIERLAALDAASTLNGKYDLCHPIVERILARYRTVPRLSMPLRPVHGDPKLGNIIFDAAKSEAIALIDFGAVGSYPLPLEVGDMLRSFCLTTRFDAPVFDHIVWTAALAAYRETATTITIGEWDAIPDGFRTVILELAARYVIDAYMETHFTPDAGMYVDRFEQGVDKSRRLLTLLDLAEQHGLALP